MSVEAIAQEVAAAAALPLPQAVTLPREAYIDEDYFHFEAERIFRRDWMCLAHVSQLKTAGSFLAVDLLGEPLLVVRDREMQIRVLSRVCAHRAMDIMPEGFDFSRQGETGTLSCPYHRWIYNLDGSLRGCAHMQRAEGFDKRDWRLPEFRSAVWNGFVFINLDGQASSLSEQYAAFDAAIAPWNVADAELVITMEWECEFNWKVMIENWMESYHHIGAHAKTLNPMMPGEDTWIEPEHPHFIRAHLPFNARMREAVRADIAGEARMPGFLPVAGLSHVQQCEWGLFLGYPCFMFLTMRDRVLWYRLLPVSAGRCKLLTTTLVSRQSMAMPDLAARIEAETKLLRDFHLEDMVVNAAVQTGLRSRAVVRGRLSHLEEPVWLIQRHVAARIAGAFPAQAERLPYSGPYAAPSAAEERVR
ncbi:MAG: aromatic ring-hydroxylating oxygenase subunit alpha [Rhizomicrobium sp.]